MMPIDFGFDITVSWRKYTGTWHYRVHLSPEQDWSGTANSAEEAWEKSMSLMRTLLGEDFNNYFP